MPETLPRVQQYIDAARINALKIEDIPAETPRLAIDRVGVIGAGVMGGGIAMNFLTAGIPVTLVDMSQEALDRGVAIIERNYDRAVKRGTMAPAEALSAKARLKPTLDFVALSEASLIIEAVYEDMDVKKDVFCKLDGIAKPGAILASNTSNLNIDELAASTSRPHSVLGMHFFSPAHVMKLLEVVRGKLTGKSELASVMDLSVRIGKIPVVSGVCHGFIGNRMLNARQKQAEALLLEGANFWEMDEALLEFGFPMGPWQMADLAGIDLGWHRNPERIENLRDALCAAGRWGQKTKKGFYDYDEGGPSTASSEVQAIIAGFVAKGGKQPRDIGKDEIRERLLFPMINEAALILEEGIAQRASDIDIVWLNGYGWPASTGGPVFWANHLGIQAVVEGLRKYDLPISSRLAGAAATGQL